MNRQIRRTLLCAMFLLLASGDPGRALSVFLSGPGVVNNYPPNNVISMRLITTTTSETTVTWGLQGGAGSSSYLMGTIGIPANQHIGFGSAALPAGFPPGVYTLYANEAGTIALGPTLAMGAGASEGRGTADPIDSLERDLDAILRGAPGAGANLRPFLFGLLAAEGDPARRERLERLIERAGE